MIDVADNNAVYYYHFDGLCGVAALSNVNGEERKFKASKKDGESFDRKKNVSGVEKEWQDYMKFGVTKPSRVPEGCYFMLGDNIPNSVDSRYYGAISKEMIIGKVTKIYWPPHRIGILY